jgi:hypothetical protein
MLATNTEMDSMGGFKCTMNENRWEYEAASICQEVTTSCRNVWT